jgi:hypothetical protein
MVAHDADLESNEGNDDKCCCNNMPEVHSNGPCLGSDYDGGKEVIDGEDASLLSFTQFLHRLILVLTDAFGACPTFRDF